MFYKSEVDIEIRKIKQDMIIVWPKPPAMTIGKQSILQDTESTFGQSLMKTNCIY